MRNIWCFKYSECLSKAIAQNKKDFSCQDCKFIDNLETSPKDLATLKEDMFCCKKLLVAIFYPEQYFNGGIFARSEY